MLGADELGPVQEHFAAFLGARAVPELVESQRQEVKGSGVLVLVLVEDGIDEEELPQGVVVFLGLEEALAERVVRDRKSTRLNSSHIQKSRMPSSA